MAWILDFVIIGILCWCIFSGYRKGFVKTVFSCLSLVCAIMLAYLFGDMAGEYIKETSVFDNMSASIAEQLSKGADEYIDSADFTEKAKDSKMGKLLTSIGVDVEALYEDNEEEIKNAAKDGKGGFAESVAEEISHVLAMAAGTLLVFIGSYLLLRVLSALLSKICEIPGLRQLNKTGGILCGFILGFAGIYIFCMVVNILMPYVSGGKIIYAGMEKDTILFSFFSDFNPIVFLLF